MFFFDDDELFDFDDEAFDDSHIVIDDETFGCKVSIVDEMSLYFCDRVFNLDDESLSFDGECVDDFLDGEDFNKCFNIDDESLHVVGELFTLNETRLVFGDKVFEVDEKSFDFGEHFNRDFSMDEESLDLTGEFIKRDEPLDFGDVILDTKDKSFDLGDKAFNVGVGVGTFNRDFKMDEESLDLGGEFFIVGSFDFGDEAFVPLDFGNEFSDVDDRFLDFPEETFEVDDGVTL